MKRTFTLLTALLLAPLAALHATELKLAAVLSDHMVLQCERPIPVWGWANAGEKVTVEFAGQTKTATVDTNRKWQVKLDPMPASAEPRTLKVNNLVFPDVLIGEVWLCSGQSNMGMSVGESANAEQEIAAADHRQLRLFTVAQNPSLQPVEDVKGQWAACTPQTVRSFSAAAYFFGRKIQTELRVPVGLIHSSVGGTPAEAWTRLDALKKLGDFGERAEKEVAEIIAQPETTKRFPAERAAWEEKHNVRPPAVAEIAKGWADPALDTSDWKEVTLPSQWGQLGFKSGGVFWLRKEINLPESAAGNDFRLSLVWLTEQYDTTFWNGAEVGHTIDAPPEFYTSQRSCMVPGRLVKAGRNVIAVRIVSATEKAGLWVSGHQLGVPVADPRTVGDQWLVKQESAFALLSAAALAARPKPSRLPLRNVSSSLYSGMIAPLVPYGMRGVVWYQGESNVPRHAEYRQLLTRLIEDWRAQWAQGDFPFIIQQLVNNGLPPKDADQSRAGWPMLREAQMQVASSVPNTGIAVGIELGSSVTIHPKNKQDVGCRLALVALEKTYRHKIESSGPSYQGMKIEGPAIHVTFTHAVGLNAKGGQLQRFAIAGADKKFFWAEAKIDGESVVVSSPQVPQPVAVRYAWADNPEGCNLYNAVGLPAAPFRTDIQGQ